MTEPRSRATALAGALGGATGTLVVALGASVVGVGVVSLLLLVTGSDLFSRTALWVTALGYAGAAAVLGALAGLLLQRRTLAWRFAGRVPDPDEARRTARLPLEVGAVTLGLWLGGAVVLFVVAVSVSGVGSGVRLALAVGLGGLSTAGAAALVVERAGRGALVEALQVARPERAWTVGVTARLVLSWLLTSAVPVLGVLLVVLLDAPGEEPGDERGGVLLLGGVALGVGALATALLARSVGAPLVALRGQVERVGEGDLDVDVRVQDAGEIGALQDAVATMTEGLRERRRVTDLFGRHVGQSVAAQALESGSGLGGEVREVVALFVDVVDSTALAARTPPEELVEVLNRFFGAVVDAVDDAGGLLNKFEGDAALCVFGAPAPLADPAAAALAVALRIRDAVAEGGEIDCGVGVATGRVFAGRLGAASRMEYTVIGDAVNEAARLVDVATDLPGRVAVSRGVLDACTDEDLARGWEHARDVRLRGRAAETEVWTHPGAPGPPR